MLNGSPLQIAGLAMPRSNREIVFAFISIPAPSTTMLAMASAISAEAGTPALVRIFLAGFGAR